MMKERMAEQTIQATTLDNGLVVIVEPMAGVRSAAFSFLLPAGSVYDPPGKNAAAAVLCEMLPRGAGSRDSRELSNALDDLGVQGDEHVGVAHLSLSGAMIADNLEAALRLYRDLIREPHLPADEFEPARAGVVQTIRGNEDEPRQKVVTELRLRCFEVPWGLPSDGTLTGLESLTYDDVVQQFRTGVRPNGGILGIAGAVDPTATMALIAELFSDWPAGAEAGFELGPRGAKRDHIAHDSTQTHIGIAYEAIPYNDPEYYAAWAAVNVLSGGMSARLFTEVREKRGLCYAINASLTSLKHAGQVLCYAGTTNERAQQTLDVTLAELRRLGGGIGEDELDRCKAGAKSALIMQQESTRSRAGSLARDWYHLGRVRPLTEVRREIESLTTDRVLDYVRSHPADDITILTLGPKPLEG
jgi:predicted Zn-dependent peptidase